MHWSSDAAFIVDDLLPARRAMRVALVTDTALPEPSAVGQRVARVAEGLRSRHHTVQLVRARATGDQALPADRDAATPSPFAGMTGLRYTLDSGSPSAEALVSLWSRQRPDVVLLATEGPLGRSALRAALKLRLSVVSDFGLHPDTFSRYYGVGWLQTPIAAYLRKFHNRTRCTVVPTDARRRQLQLLGFERLEVVPHGVDTQRFAPHRRQPGLRARWGADSATPVLLYAGRLETPKSLDLLRRAHRAARDGDTGAILVVLAEGPERPELPEDWADVHIAGPLEGESLADHYASADVLIQPGLDDHASPAVPQAMASGLAVVSYDFGAVSDWIRHGITGLLAQPGDAQGLVAQARRAAGDRDLQRQLGEAACRAAAAQDWERVLDGLESVLIRSQSMSSPPSLEEAHGPDSAAKAH